MEFRDLLTKEMKKKEIILLIYLLIGLVIGLITYLFSKSLLAGSITFIFISILLIASDIVRKTLASLNNLKKMEEVFPDFIELVSSNLRSGMTTDKALLLSSRKEFYPLDLEILALGKDITTGKE